MKTKVCTKCGIEKSIGEFYVQRASRDKHRSWCHHCCSDYQRRHRYADGVEARAGIKRKCKPTPAAPKAVKLSRRFNPDGLTARERIRRRLNGGDA